MMSTSRFCRKEIVQQAELKNILKIATGIACRVDNSASSSSTRNE